MTAVLEAKRYIDNAKDILRDKARKEDGYYQDRKYVKVAGHTAYVGMLVALDDFLGRKRKGRKDVEWYQEHLSKLDKKALNKFNAAYDTLHLAMGYDGNPSAKVSAAGIEDAISIINWVEARGAA